MWTCAAVVLAVAACACGITRDQFYPFGPGVDVQLPKGHEVSSPEIPLNVPVLFYGEKYDSIFVNNFGVLSFRADIPSFINTEFPLPYPSIAPFYTNIDTTLSGTVYYRETNDTRVITKASEYIQEFFLDYYDFNPTSVFIATWVDVTYTSESVERTNTFQVAIISNGNESFVELLYPERDIRWIQGEYQDSTFPDAKAQAGFIAEDSRVFHLRGSGSHQIRNIVSWSNIHDPGRYIFRVGNIQTDKTIAVPDQYNQSEIEEEEESKTCAQSGPSVCHTQARCVDHEAGLCCQCNDEYYGNGKSCIKNDVPLRVHGRLFGEVNGQQLNDINMQAYIVVADGRTYTALSQAPPSLGSSMQSLNVLGGVIGWLFAKPFGNAKNGYQLTGALFNHTAEIFYPKTGDRVTIKQDFLGHDVFDQITLEADVRGTVPGIGFEEKLDIKEYEEQYTLVEPGVVRSQSTRVFINKQTKEQYEQIIKQTITFSPCRYAPLEDEDKAPVTLEVSKNYLSYETKENIIRYGMSNKINPIGHEDPCFEGRSKCGTNSVCVSERESYKCICNSGYQENGSVCSDIDECIERIHNCDINADCFNYEGGFTCKCKHGYSGDGVNCDRQQSGCSRNACDANAECIEDYNGDVRCVCKPGFVGDGKTYCNFIEESTCDVLNNCSPYATCDYSSSTNSYVCQCNSGYVGDGYHCLVYDTTTQSNEADYNDTFVLPMCSHDECRCPPGYSLFIEFGNNLCKIYQSETEQTNEAYNFTGPGMRCESDYECPSNAKCLYSQMSHIYECQCLPGYQGDGIECIQKPGADCEECGQNAHCVNTSADEHICMCDIGFHRDGYHCRPNLGCANNSDCEYNAECRYDAISGTNVCQCVDGYTKDANDACILDGTLCNGALCAEHASCLYDVYLDINYCHCDDGYEGDAVVKCAEVGRTCDVANDCSPDGECLQTEYSFECACKEGFIGNGYSCTLERTCRNFPEICDDHASCLVHNDVYVCECNSGYNGNGSYCQHNPRQIGNFLIASGDRFVYKIPFELSTYIFATPIKDAQIAVGIDVDCQTGNVYWGDVVSNTIQTASYDGLTSEQFLFADIKSPEGLAIDWISRNVYWTDSKTFTIEVANLNTKKRHILFSKEGIANPRGIAVHPQRGKIFWSDWNRSAPKIEWANLDGTDRSIFLSSPDVHLPNGLVIDWNTDRLCYTDAGLHTIECVDIESRRKETIVTNCTYPFGLIIKDETFYWTDWKSLKIEYVNTRTEARGKLPIATSGGRLYGLTKAVDQCPRLSNVCQYHNGNCDYNQLCLPNGRNGRTCI